METEVKQNIITSVFNTYILSPEGAATLLLIFALLMKLYVNKKVEAIDYKKMIISVPGEIVFLVLGFQMSAMIAGNIETLEYIVWTIFLFIALLIEYVIEKWCQDKLAGTLTVGVYLRIILMYIIAIFFYYKSVYGGILNA